MSVTRVGVINRLCLTSRASDRSEHQDVTLIKDQLAREMCGISKVLTRPLLISCGCETHKAAHYERVKSLEIDYRQVDLPLSFNLEDSRQEFQLVFSANNFVFFEQVISQLHIFFHYFANLIAFRAFGQFSQISGIPGQKLW